MDSASLAQAAALLQKTYYERKNLVLAYEGLGNNRAAIGSFETTLRFNPDHERAQEHLDALPDEDE